MARPYLGGSSAGVKSLTASATLSPADSGKVILFTPPSGAGALNITLPACSAGSEFTIIQKSAYDTAVCKVTSAEGNNIVGGILAQTGAGDNSGANVDFIEWGSGTVEGDMVSLVSDGSKWYVVGSRSKLTSNGIAFRSS
tara:strand:+ start:221 stop:640 length:420 start_codon:yes stop_codon:yes gene_type:complete